MIADSLYIKVEQEQEQEQEQNPRSVCSARFDGFVPIGREGGHGAGLIKRFRQTWAFTNVICRRVSSNEHAPGMFAIFLDV
jgi:hypothetical protein